MATADTPDNPPAFPNGGAYGRTGDYLPEGGMTLHDWFAGQALPAVIAATSAGQHEPIGLSEGKSTVQAMASDAYALANAMLAERAKVSK